MARSRIHARCVRGEVDSDLRQILQASVGLPAQVGGSSASCRHGQQPCLAGDPGPASPYQPLGMVADPRCLKSKRKMTSPFDDHVAL